MTMTTDVTAISDRRQRLIAAARELFGSGTYEQVTTTQIAKTADVAYGLIAHHFGNKRGIYLAVMDDIRAELAAEQDTPVPGDTLGDQLHNALRRHVRYIDKHKAGFIALMRGGLGADPDLRTMFDQVRWGGASRILRAIGIDSDPPPTLRAAMRAWVAQFDELMLDRLDHGDITRETVVRLAADQLIATLNSVLALEPDIALTDDALALLDAHT